MLSKFKHSKENTADKPFIEDRVFTRLVSVWIVTILICVICLSGTTYAWFEAQATSGINTIYVPANRTLASYSVTVRGQSRDPESGSSVEVFSGNVSADGPATIDDLEAGVYTVYIKPANSEAYNTGFMQFIIRDEGQPSDSLAKTYATDELVPTRSADVFSYTLRVAAKGGSLTFAPVWGTPENFGYKTENLLPAESGVEIGSASSAKSAEFALIEGFRADQYIRLGNGSTLRLGDLFTLASDEETQLSGDRIYVSANAKATESTLHTEEGLADCVYSINSEDWRESTLSFSGEGPVEISIRSGKGTALKANFEVVDGVNLTGDMNTSDIPDANLVLLKNIALSGSHLDIDGRSVFGNGFELDVSEVNGFTNSGSIVLKNGAVIDNTLVRGAVFSGADASNTRATVSSEEGAIRNSMITGGWVPLRVTGDTLIRNSKLYGGTFANAEVLDGTFTINGLTTVNENGPGVVFGSDASRRARIDIVGGIAQYNFVKKTNSNVTASVAALMNDIFGNHEELVFDVGGESRDEKYANFGFASFSDKVASNRINDKRSDKDGYTVIEGSGYAFAYMQESDGRTAYLMYPEEYTTSQQSPYAPVFAWALGDQEVENENVICRVGEDGNIEIILREGWPFQLDVNALATAVKYGAHNLRLTVQYVLNGNHTIDINDGKVTFVTEGTYTIHYVYTDDMLYGQSGSTVRYEKDVTVVVSYMPGE